MTLLGSPSIPFAVAPSRLDDPPMLVPRPPLPACLQAPGKLEAWEYMGFRVDDNRFQRQQIIRREEEIKVFESLGLMLSIRGSYE